MKRKMTIVEVRELFGSDKVFATGDGFIYNDCGKYRSGLTFVLSASFELDKDGQVLNPICFVEDREVTDSFNLDLGGSAGILFGDFWTSKKGAPCFRPTDPKQAKHLLVAVKWGGAFNRSYGYNGNAVKECSAVYFRRARSNGGGLGRDYWVLPVGFVHLLDTNTYRIDSELAKAYCQKHSDLQAQQRAEADRLYREKVNAEAAAKAARDEAIPRLTEIQAELKRLYQPQTSGITYGVDQIILDDGPYFKLGNHKHLYGQAGITEAEEYLAQVIEWITEAEKKAKAKADAAATFKPRYEAYRDQVETLGWQLKLNDERAVLDKMVGQYSTKAYDFNGDDFRDFCQEVKAEADRRAEEERKLLNNDRICKILAETELPRRLWSLFADSEELDSVIIAEAQAILAAAQVELDGETQHELVNCGYDRRCGAIRRVLERVGGHVGFLDIDSQDSSRELALFIAS